MTGAESTVTVKDMNGDNGANAFAAWEATAASKLVSFAPKYTVLGKTVEFEVTMNTAVPPVATADKGFAYVSDETSYNGLYDGYAMYRIDTNLDGTVSLAAANIKFDGNAKFSANGSAILKNDGSFLTYVSSNTQYLVRTVDAKNVATYTPVTGTQAMAAYSGAKLFYVDTNNDNVADYVYIYSGTKVGATAALVFVTTPAYTDRVTDGVATSTIVANVNGVANQTLIAKDTNTAKIHELAQNVGSLYKVTLTADGYVNTVKAVTITSDNIDAIPGYKFGYLGTAVTVFGDTLMGNGLSVRAIDANGAASTIISNETDVKLDTVALAGKGVWAVYTDYASGAYNNMAKFIYVGSKPAATAAAAATEIQGDYATAFDLTDATVDSVTAQLLAMANKKLADKGLTGVTVKITDLKTGGADLTNPIAHNNTATPIDLSYSFNVTDNLGATATSTATAHMNNKYSAATANTAVADALKSVNVTAANVSNQAAIETAVKTELGTTFTGHTADFTVTMTSTPDIAAGKPVNVTVTGTLDSLPINVSGTVYLK